MSKPEVVGVLPTGKTHPRFFIVEKQHHKNVVDILDKSIQSHHGTKDLGKPIRGVSENAGDILREVTIDFLKKATGHDGFASEVQAKSKLGKEA